MIKKLITITAFCLVVFSANSATHELYGKKADEKIPGSEVVRYKDFTNIPNYVKFKSGNELPLNKIENWLASYYNSDVKFGLTLLSTETDRLGFTHYRYQQIINNIPVKLGMYIAHVKNGMVISMNGELFSQNINSNSVNISESKALSKALDFVGATKYKWEIAAEENHLKWEQNNANATYYPTGKLIYINKNGKPSNELKLAFVFNIYAQEPLSRQEVYVDAANGEIIWSENKIHHVDEVGSAVTGYSGTQTMTSNNAGGGVYNLQETGRGNGIRTFNCNNTTNYTNTNFTNSSSSWNLAGVDKYATDAHWGSEMTYDYFLNKHGRNSIDGAGFRLDSYVHYDVNYGNAFWDGQRMTYGDGSSGNRPFTALDIAGHEITHGLTTFTADLVYQDESGALNESFSDIFGVSVEFISRPGNANWLMGEDLGFTIRNMSNPNANGDPDTYFGTNWAALGGGDNGGVHTNSGVQNFWYYLLTIGGTGTNDNGDSYNVSGLGLDKAGEIAFRNLTVYLTTSSGYVDARFYAIQSAADLFGACTPEVESVTNAWYAVGVGSAYQPFAVSDFESCITTSCSVPFTVDFNNTSVNGGTFDWDFGDGNSSSVMNPSHTYTSYGTYTVELFIDGGASCGSDTETKVGYITIDSTLACNTIMPNSGSSTLTSCSGTLYDSGGPCSIYGANQTAQVTIAPTGAGKVNLNFTFFDVESGDQGGTICNYDNLKIYDGPSTSSTLIGTYCNNNLPPSTISSSGGSITILFLSDPGLEESGFQIDWTCELPTLAPVVDFAVDMDTTCTGVVKFTDLSINGASSWSWNFGDGNTSTDQNPNHTYSQPGTYTVQLTASNIIGSDSQTKTNFIYVNMPEAPAVLGDSICTNNVANLSATGVGVLRWYANATGGSSLYSGTNFTTPVLTSTTTYYVEDFIAATIQNLGKPDNSGGGGYLNNEHYLVFDVYQPMFLQSVTVYANTTGYRTIQLQNSFGTVLETRNAHITAGTRTANLYFNIPPGEDYRLVLADASTVKDLYRNNAGVSYPYTLNGIGSVKNSSAGLSYYYYFYDWDVKGVDCKSTREPVTALVNMCTGIEDALNQNNVVTYFNSSSNQLELLLNGIEKGNYSISVFNAVGQLVIDEKAQVTSDQYRKSIDLSNASNGVYLIRITNNKTSFTNKFIK
ncbi:MAG: M4 family metallopeptidase [Flavobacteriales bacterium]|nr:M4 family metallopeptidase [Flavobacteriales bacterium]